VLASGSIVLAQQKMDNTKSMDMGKKGAPSAQTTHQAKATVKSVDPAAGRVTLAHEPIKSLNWPSMTMGFKVKDKALFDKLAVGSQVQVDIVQEGQDYVVTAVKKSSADSTSDGSMIDHSMPGIHHHSTQSMQAMMDSCQKMMAR